MVHKVRISAGLERMHSARNLDSRDRTPVVTLARLQPGSAGAAVGACVGETGLMAQAKKIALYMIIVFVLYTIITSPQRAAEMVQIGFEGISSAAQGVGEFMTQLIK
ncbi:hypothetical protein Srufu_037100 [Streptomyces libani subsp. rufus]|nr:hypothetical protein Srufu_037100 [Streptomyces libani subsp. rufus]